MLKGNRLCVADVGNFDHLHTLLTYARKLSAHIQIPGEPLRTYPSNVAPRPVVADHFEIFVISLPTKRNACSAIVRVIVKHVRQTVRNAVVALTRGLHLGVGFRRPVKSSFHVVQTREYQDETVVVWIAPRWTSGNVLRSLLWSSLMVLRFRRNSPALHEGCYMQGVHLGDLVASSLLRVVPSRFRVGNVAILFFELWRSGIICEWALNETGIAGEFASTPEPTYPHAILARVFEFRGATFIEVGGRGEIRVSSSWLIDGARPVVQVQRLNARTSAPSRGVEELGRKRLDGELSHAFLKQSVSRDERWPDSYLAKVLRPSGRTSRAVVFLHDFADGQLICGIDGFADLLEWAEYTVRHLIGPNWTEVLVRPHPHSRYPANAHYLRALEKSVQRYPQVRFVSPNAPLKDLIAGDTTLIVSHHGTIVLETVALGKNAIYSGLSPWGGSWNIGFEWTTPVEYAALLQDPRLLVAPNQATISIRKSELADFVSSLQPKVGYHAVGAFHQAATIEKFHEQLTSLEQHDVYGSLLKIWSEVSVQESLSLLPPARHVDLNPSLHAWFRSVNGR